MNLPEQKCTCTGPGTFSICYKHGVAKYIPKEVAVAGSTDMFPDAFKQYVWDQLDLEKKMDENCSVCKKKVETMAFKNTGVCGENCRKVRDGEVDRPGAQTDAGITNLLNQPTGEINLNHVN